VKLLAVRATVIVTLFLAGCATSTQKAPVIERDPNVSRSATGATSQAGKPALAKKSTMAEKSADWRPDSYTVKKGDTLHAIGLEYGFDYKDLARWNDIAAPSYTIRVGQVLKLKAPAGVVETTASTPAAEGAVASAISAEQPAQAKPLDEPVGKPLEAKAEAAIPAESSTGKQLDEDAVDWGWPTAGKVLTKFSDSNKGLDIAGSVGQPILAAASGKVVYSGSGLRGYGKLVIIKHNKTYLSAYANNSQILVKEGQDVTKGQKIAEMGNTDTDTVKLHFEIRKLGQPTDPEKFLPPVN
jgi:lipoprotein NlpD